MQKQYIIDTTEQDKLSIIFQCTKP